MIYFLHGPDTYSSRAKLRAIIAAFLGKTGTPQGGGAGLARVDAADDPSAVFTVGRTRSLFAEKELIIIERISSASGAAASHIEAELGRWAEDRGLTVVFWEGEIAVRKSSLAGKILARAEKAQEFKPLAAPALGRWLDRELTERGMRLAPEEKRLLLSNCGSDLWALSSELDKARDGWSFHSSDHTTLEVWDFTDVFLRHRRSAFLPFAKLVGIGRDPLYLLAALGSALRTAAIVWKGVQNGRLKTLASRLHPFVVRKNTDLARRLDTVALRRVFMELVRADVELKTGRLPSPLPLLKLVLRREPKTAA